MKSTFTCPLKEGSVIDKLLMQFVIIYYGLIKYIYKGIYFYNFPYVVVPLSYYLYDYHMITLKKTEDGASVAE